MTKKVALTNKNTTRGDSFFKCLVYQQKLSFFTKLAISLLLAKFACANLAAKYFDVKLLNSGVVLYLSWWPVIFFSILQIFLL